MKKVYFIYNPRSGKGTISSKLSYVISKFTEAGYEVTVRPTQAPLDARDNVIRICSDESSDYDLILCSGGDGTLNEVIQGIMTSPYKIPVAYIPAGSTNDFARSMKTPKKIEKIVDCLIKGEKAELDIGSFNDKFFTYVAAFGAMTEVSYETPQPIKNKLGHAAYILEGMKHLSKIQSYHLKITYDDQTIEGDYVLGLISNTASIGGLLSMGDFSLTDGLYEVTLIKTPNSPIELQSILSSLLNIKQAVNTEYVTFFKTSDIRIECGSELMWTIDGESGGDQRDVHIRNNQRALEFIVPDPDKI